MISWKRRLLRIVYGLEVPPRTVGSDAVIMHSTPSTTPIPFTCEAPTSYSDAVGAEGADLEEGGVAVEQELDLLAGQQPAA